MKKFVRIVTLTVTFVVSMIISATTSASAAPPVYIWEHNVVYLENHAPGWPISRAAENLDNGSALDIRVVKKCPKNVQCVPVYSVKNVPGKYQIGITKKMVYVKQHRLHSATIELENSVTRYHDRLGLACHEIGHSVGLPHSNAKTCMQPVIGGNSPTTISKNERKTLHRWYK